MAVVFPVLRMRVYLNIPPAASAVDFYFRPQEIRPGAAIPQADIEDANRAVVAGFPLVTKQSGGPACLYRHFIRQRGWGTLRCRERVYLRKKLPIRSRHGTTLLRHLRITASVSLLGLTHQIFLQRFADVAERLAVLMAHGAQGVVCLQYVARTLQLRQVVHPGVVI